MHSQISGFNSHRSSFNQTLIEITLYFLQMDYNWWIMARNYLHKQKEKDKANEQYKREGSRTDREIDKEQMLEISDRNILLRRIVLLQHNSNYRIIKSRYHNRNCKAPISENSALVWNVPDTAPFRSFQFYTCSKNARCVRLLNILNSIECFSFLIS